MKFRVAVRKAGGSEEKRIIEAASRFEVYGQIEKEGGNVISLEEGEGFTLPAWTQTTIGTGIKTEERITFTKNLAAMLAAGLSLPRALSVLERQTSNRFLRKIITDLETRVKSGVSFHEALENHAAVFAKLFIAMTKAGEESGNLSSTLKIVAQQMENSYTLSKKVRGAMIYPAIVFIAIVVIGILMLLFVVPTLAATFKSLSVSPPLLTQIILGISAFMVHNAVLVIVTLIIVLLGGALYIRTKQGSAVVLFVSLHLPVVSELVRETFSARAARTLGSLLSSGVEMLTALSITQEVVGDNRFGKIVGEAETRVRKGETLSVSFIEHSKLYPVLIGEMIAVGEETGKVSEMLTQVAQYYEEDVEDRTKDLSTVIEPLLMLFIGTLVGIFAIAMIAPIYSLAYTIS